MNKTLVAFAALLLLVSACQNSVGPAQPAAQEPEPTPTAPQVPTPAPEVTEKAPEPAPPAETKSADAADLGGLLNKKGTLEYQVDYDVLSTVQGMSIKSSMSQYIKDAGAKIRIDTLSSGFESRTYVLEESVSTCTKMGSWTCSTGERERSPADEAEREVASGDSGYTITKTASRTIAKVSADCYTATKPGTELRYCFSREGVPLYTWMSAGGIISELTARSFSLSVDDTAFKLPA